MNTITIDLPIIPPTATAQQKGVCIIGGHPHFFTKKKVREAENFLAALLAPYRPAAPIEGPIVLTVEWRWPFRKSEKRGIVKAGLPVPHVSRPDLDNLEKNLIDTLTRLQFWRDDSQVYCKHTVKRWAAAGSLSIVVQSIDKAANEC